ncbi:MAG: hypothetical protein KAS32_04055 [Candidatus Peribacteraceae bacterium]|nr:hypothetical protein [Candidatus Peribacteraceae bacterium]
MANQRIKVNKIKCLSCNDIIESIHRYDFKTCSCGDVSVEGGKEYIRRFSLHGAKGFEELSEHED